jgi:hypothetical protein
MKNKSKLKSNFLYKIILNRNKFYKNKIYLIPIVYFLLLFILDYSGLMNLYGENFCRRLINMYRRTDRFTYYSKLNPFCESVKHVLNKEDIDKLQSIKIPEKHDFSVFSRKNTITHKCCEKYSEREEEIINEISKKVKKIYEEEIGKKLYNYGSKPSIYVYKGKDSQHLWHVDSSNRSEIYNIIICFKKVGEISPLQCKNEKNEVKSIYFEEGDAAIFNGGTTIHQVPPNKDENSERYVLSIAFTSKAELNNSKYTNNMCSYSEGGSNYFNMFKIIIAIFCINFIISFISGVNNLSYNLLIKFVFILLIIIKYVPLYFDIGLGSGRSSSIIKNLFLLLITMIITFSTKGAILFFSYFALSDVFFKRSWVEYY